MTYLLIDRYPCLQTNYRFDAAGFWSEYWPTAFQRRLGKFILNYDCCIEFFFLFIY
jgi:hypothetical protein